jgi:hypothetical protein
VRARTATTSHRRLASPASPPRRALAVFCRLRASPSDAVRPRLGASRGRLASFALVQVVDAVTPSGEDLHLVSPEADVCRSGLCCVDASATRDYFPWSARAPIPQLWEKYLPWNGPCTPSATCAWRALARSVRADAHSFGVVARSRSDERRPHVCDRAHWRPPRMHHLPTDLAHLQPAEADHAGMGLRHVGADHEHEQIASRSPALAHRDPHHLRGARGAPDALSGPLPRRRLQDLGEARRRDGQVTRTCTRLEGARAARRRCHCGLRARAHETRAPALGSCAGSAIRRLSGAGGRRERCRDGGDAPRLLLFAGGVARHGSRRGRRR